MPAYLNPGGCIDYGRRSVNLSDKQEFAAWLARNGCPKEFAERMLKGEFRAAARRYAQRSDAAPTTSTTANRTAEDYALAQRACDLAQEIHESDEDALLRAQCDLYGEEIRADYEDQEDEEDPEELDLFLDRCPECNGSDIELGYNSADDTIYTRCTQCNLRASREAADESEASMARQKQEERARWRGLRGW
jgi:hypothetical protein